MTSSIGFNNGVLSSMIERPGVHRLGMTLSAGTLTIHGANGEDLSVRNPGYVTIWDKTNPGELKTYMLTSNFSFSDASGDGDVDGNEFGTIDGAISTNTVPFFIYFAADDNSENPKPFLCRFPNLSALPATTAIGTPSNAIADSDGDFWCFEDITVGDYDGNPVVAVGGIRMSQTGTFDWTITTLTTSDGFGKFYDGNAFVWLPVFEGSSTAGSFTYSTRLGAYHFDPSGTVTWTFNATTTGSSGTPAGNMRCIGPFYQGSVSGAINAYGAFWTNSATTVPASTNQITSEIMSGTNLVYFRTVVFGTSDSYLQVDNAGTYHSTISWRPSAQTS